MERLTRLATCSIPANNNLSLELVEPQISRCHRFEHNALTGFLPKPPTLAELEPQRGILDNYHKSSKMKETTRQMKQRVLDGELGVRGLES